MPWWHGAFAVTLVGTAVMVASQSGAWWRTAVVVGLLAVMGTAYAATPAKFVTGRGRQAYVACALACTGVAMAVRPEAAFALFIVVPNCYMLMPVRASLLATVSLLVLSSASDFSFAGTSPAVVVEVSTFGVAGLTFSLLMGGYVSSIIRQSAERAALITQLERARAELAEVSRTEGVRSERERLSREIHDAVAQNITSMLMLVRAAEAALARQDTASAQHQLALAQGAGQDGLRAARDLIAAGTPHELDGTALVPALRRCCASLGARYGFQAGLEVEGRERELPVAVATVLLRATQESLANVGRHAGARRADVVLAFGPDEVVLDVSDDGRGFVPSAQAGFGTRQLRSRAAELGGSAEVLSAPGEGTVVRVALPAPLPVGQVTSGPPTAAAVPR